MCTACVRPRPRPSAHQHAHSLARSPGPRFSQCCNFETESLEERGEKGRAVGKGRSEVEGEFDVTAINSFASEQDAVVSEQVKGEGRRG